MIINLYSTQNTEKSESFFNLFLQSISKNDLLENSPRCDNEIECSLVEKTTSINSDLTKTAGFCWQNCSESVTRNKFPKAKNHPSKKPSVETSLVASEKQETFGSFAILPPTITRHTDE